jgi:hypothetical protein
LKPGITKPPKIKKREDLLKFLEDDKVKSLRPLGKIVSI